MKKSIDQVWNQIQSQRLAEQQRIITQERNLNEQRERARQEYLNRVRMYERASSPAAAAAAAGAGAGGGGGRLPDTEVSTPQTNNSTSGQSILYYSFDSDENTLFYFIYNFDTDNLTSVNEITMDNIPDVYPITEGGFFLSSLNSENNNQDFSFLNCNGDLIWQDFSDNSDDVDIENFSRYIAAYYLKDSAWKLVVFDINSDKREFEFENPIEGGGYSYDDVWSGGFIVVEDIFDFTNTLRFQKYYIINFEAGTSTFFYEIETDLGDVVNVYQYAFSDKILLRKNDTFEVWSSLGNKISEFDVDSELNPSSWSLQNFTFLSETGSFLIIGYAMDNVNSVIFFSGVENQFSYKLSELSNYVLSIEEQKNYRFPNNRDPKGSALIRFYDGNPISVLKPVNQELDYYPESYILPVWSTDVELRDFYTFSSLRGVFEIGGSNGDVTRTEDYITLLIDNNRLQFYPFSDFSSSEGGGDISLGGDGMYDTGNIISVDSTQIQYTHIQYPSAMTNGLPPRGGAGIPQGGLNIEDFVMESVVFTGPSASALGTSSEYFTNLYPGLFVFAAQNTEIDEFSISGTLGGGKGTFSSSNFELNTNSQTYSVFVKRVWDKGSPSVNHIIIVNNTSENISQVTGETPTDDQHTLSGLSPDVTEIYYLLLALNNGEFLESVKVEEIVDNFLSILGQSSDINELLTNLNSDYENITDVVSQDENYSILRLNRTGDESTIIPTNISKLETLDSNDDKLTNKSIIRFYSPIEFENSNSSWLDLSDYENRFYYLLSPNRNSGNDSFNYFIDNSTELVLKDLVNNQYWAIQFTEWNEDGDVASFAYTRQLIEGGTFSGDVITFTHSSWNSPDVDIISPGVLELKRSRFGGLYNRVVEYKSNGSNPSGTLWNSGILFDMNYEWNKNSYKHVIVGLDGDIIDSVTTSSSYYIEEPDGSTFILEDPLLSKVYISNNQNNSEFTLLDGYYLDFDGKNETTEESGLKTGDFILGNLPKFRIVSDNSVSSEFILPFNEKTILFTSLNIFNKGFFILTVDNEDYNLYLYNLEGNLIDTYTIALSETVEEGGFLESYGNRITFGYSSIQGLNVLIFDGVTVTELALNGSGNWTEGNFDVSVNDYSWWAD